MPFFRPLSALFVVGLAASTVLGQPFGLTNRVAATTLKMPPIIAANGYLTSNALGNPDLHRAVAIVSAPGDTNRLFIVEQPGRIVVTTNLASPTRTGTDQWRAGVATEAGDAIHRAEQ